MGSCYRTQGAQSGALCQPRGVGWQGVGGRPTERGYTYGWFLLLYRRNQHNTVKQLSTHQNKNAKREKRKKVYTKAKNLSFQKQNLYREHLVRKQKKMKAKPWGKHCNSEKFDNLELFCWEIIHYIYPSSNNPIEWKHHYFLGEGELCRYCIFFWIFFTLQYCIIY